VIPLKYVEAVIHPVIVLSTVFADSLSSFIISEEKSLFLSLVYTVHRTTSSISAPREPYNSENEYDNKYLQTKLLE